MSDKQCEQYVLLKPFVMDPEGHQRRDQEVIPLIKEAIEATPNLVPVCDGETEGMVVTDITKELITCVFESDIVVVDANRYEKSKPFYLSPYLYYLMGFSHSLGNKTILVSESSRFVVDNRILRKYAITYKAEDLAGIQKFKGEFRQAVEEILAKRKRVDNPIQDYLELAQIPTADIKKKLEKVEKEHGDSQRQTVELNKRIVLLEKDLAGQKAEVGKLKKKEAEMMATYDRAVEDTDAIKFRPIGHAK